MPLEALLLMEVAAAGDGLVADEDLLLMKCTSVSAEVHQPH